MAIFSGGVFFASQLDVKVHAWAPRLIGVFTQGRRVMLLSRFVNWAVLIYLFHTVAPPSQAVYRTFMGGISVAVSLDTYWGLIFFGFLRAKVRRARVARNRHSLAPLLAIE